MFKAAALAPARTPAPFVPRAVLPKSFAANALVSLDPDAAAAQLCDELAQLSPVGAVIEEELRQSRTPANEDPVADMAMVRAEAFAAGHAAAAQAYEAELAAARQLIARLQGAFAQQLEIDPAALAPGLETLVMAIARAVVEDELTAAPHSVRVRVDSALTELADGCVAELCVHPDDLGAFQDVDEQTKNRLRIVGDRSIERGDFRLRRGDSELVDRISERFERMGRALGK